MKKVISKTKLNLYLINFFVKVFQTVSVDKRKDRNLVKVSFFLGQELMNNQNFV